MIQCPFCLEDCGSNEVERLEHVLDAHSTRLAMADACIRTMRSEGVGFESSSHLTGYRDWLDDRALISTRRKHPSGTVHEMADRGVKTLCGIDLPEPWDWTDDKLTCKRCLAREAS